MGFCQGRGKVKTNICKYVEECNEKIECTTCDDIERGIYPVYIAGFGECKRDDRLSEKVGATMNREKEEMLDFYERVMIPQLKSQGNHFKSKIKEKECQIKEMQSHIDCLKAELAEIQQNKQELLEEPIRAANYLIDRYMEYAKEFDRCLAVENAGKIVAGSPVEGLLLAAQLKNSDKRRLRR